MVRNCKYSWSYICLSLKIFEFLPSTIKVLKSTLEKIIFSNNGAYWLLELLGFTLRYFFNSSIIQIAKQFDSLNGSRLLRMTIEL